MVQIPFFLSFLYTWVPCNAWVPYTRVPPVPYLLFIIYMGTSGTLPSFYYIHTDASHPSSYLFIIYIRMPRILLAMHIFILYTLRYHSACSFCTSLFITIHANCLSCTSLYIKIYCKPLILHLFTTKKYPSAC